NRNGIAGPALRPPLVPQESGTRKHTKALEVQGQQPCDLSDAGTIADCCCSAVTRDLLPRVRARATAIVLLNWDSTIRPTISVKISEPHVLEMMRGLVRRGLQNLAIDPQLLE